MFENISEKLKLIAKITFWLCIICAIICTVAALYEENITFFIYAIFLAFSGWASSIFIYGFAEILELLLGISSSNCRIDSKFRTMLEEKNNQKSSTEN